MFTAGQLALDLAPLIPAGIAQVRPMIALQKRPFSVPEKWLRATPGVCLIRANVAAPVLSECGLRHVAPQTLEYHSDESEGRTR